MSEWATLALVAIALYLLECVRWIEASVLACYRSTLRFGWRCRPGTSFWGNERGGLLVLNPMALDGSLVIGDTWPLSLSPHGLTNLGVDGGTWVPHEVRYIPFSDVHEVRAEFDEVHVNGRRFLRVSSPAVAVHLSRQLTRIWSAKSDQRVSEIQAVVREAFDDVAALARWKAFEQTVRPLKVLCLSLFAVTFLIAPVALLVVGPYPSWMYLLGSVVALTITTSCAFFRIHTKLYPESRYERWVQAISMTLLPVGAMRSIDKLSRDALVGYAAAVVSPMLCGVNNASAVLRRHQMATRHTAEDFDVDSARSDAVDCAVWFSGLLCDETERALQRAHVPFVDLARSEDEILAS